MPPTLNKEDRQLSLRTMDDDQVRGAERLWIVSNASFLKCVQILASMGYKQELYRGLTGWVMNLAL